VKVVLVLQKKKETSGKKSRKQTRAASRLPSDRELSIARRHWFGNNNAKVANMGELARIKKRETASASPLKIPEKRRADSV
jgi:hypothetical protein